MERNSLGIAEEYYNNRRSEVLRTFDKKQTASFMLLENMFDLTHAEGELNHVVKWSHGVDSEEYLKNILRGNKRLIHIPGVYSHFNGYQRFNWKILDSTGQKVAFFAVKMEFGIYGIRLSETAGESSFSQVEKNLHQLVGQIPYPVLVTDRTGFRYENEALTALKTA